MDYIKKENKNRQQYKKRKTQTPKPQAGNPYRKIIMRPTVRNKTYGGAQLRKKLTYKHLIKNHTQLPKYPVQTKYFPY